MKTLFPFLAAALTLAPAAASAPVEDKIVCVDESAGGNSRLGSRKVCHTQKEWDALPHSRR